MRQCLHLHPRLLRGREAENTQMQPRARDLTQSREPTLGEVLARHTGPDSCYSNGTCPEQRVARQCHRRVSTIHERYSAARGAAAGPPSALRPPEMVLSRGHQHQHQRLLAEDGVTRDLQPTVTAGPGYQTAESKPLPAPQGPARFISPPVPGPHQLPLPQAAPSTTEDVVPMAGPTRGHASSPRPASSPAAQEALKNPNVHLFLNLR